MEPRRSTLLSDASVRYLLTVPLDPVLFDEVCARPVLEAPVRRRLLGMVRSGERRPWRLLERDDLSAEELAELAGGPAVGPEEALTIIKHRNCTGLALGELALLERRRSERRVRAGMSAHTARYGQVLGVLRNTSTPSRMAALLVDEDIAEDAAEVGRVVDGVLELGPEGIEVFLTMVKEWYDTADVLLASVVALVRD